jgi:hypothetical protein
MASPSIRGAAVLHVALGLGFGIGAIWTMRHFGEHGELPMTPWGFRSMAGPFEALPSGPFTVLGWGLAATCAVDVLAGAWLWQGRRRGAWLALATNPVALVLGLGFALPFLLAGIPIRVALVLAGRSSLR